jgi:NAD(P)-dependent dehydrogenase (short-subunit alcohol dehydrogenase family)
MSKGVQYVNDFLFGTVPKVAFNPIVVGPLLWALTRAPASVRERLIDSVSILRDEEKLVTIIKSLKWLLALGVVGKVNAKLNDVALNAWRLKSEKTKWQWNKEIAVVTGGCSGIGLLIVKGLVKKGVRVAILDIQQLPATLQGYASIRLFACDITDPAAVRSAAESIRSTMGSPTILVNNAGIADAHSILDGSDEFVRKIFDVNILSHFTTVKAFLPDMIKANKGHVVSVASLASYVSVAGIVDYSATKAAVLAFHEGLNQELKHQYKAPSVLTTSVHPKWVRTPLVGSWEAVLRKEGESLLQPREVADAIVNQIFSCSSGQIFLPETMYGVAGLRGWPNWLQEKVRDGLAKTVLGHVK